jgi:hypothetical protein
VLIRISVLFAAAALAIGSTGCSSLTRPDPIQIAAEPTPAPQVRELPGGLAPPGNNAPAPAAPPGSGG